MPEGGTLWITQNTGSIFDTYYVNGEVTASGNEVGDVFAFGNIYEFTVRDYNESMSRLRGLLEVVVPSEYQQLFYQQQFASCISLLESFLSSTFIRETCDKEDAYQRVWKSGCLIRRIKRDQRSIANGPDCLQKELLYIELVKQLIYHNIKDVRQLFLTAFGIDVDLMPLDEDILRRHDIVHRFGFNKKGEPDLIKYDDVITLQANIDGIVHSVADQILRLPSIAY